MFAVFAARTADDAWQRVADQFRSGSNVAKQMSRAGLTHEIARSAITLSDPRQRWVISRQPPINPAFALAEVVWIVRGRRDARFLTYFNRQLPRYAGDTPALHGAYGFRLRRHFGIDQLERAFAALQGKPHSRQVVLQLWDSRADLPRMDGSEAAADIPCNVVSMLKVRNGALDWLQVLRSSDVFRGLPYNLVQFTALHEVLAGWLGLELGSYSQVSDSLHVYDDCLEDVRASSPLPSYVSADVLSVRRAESERGFAELERSIEQMIDASASADEIATATLMSPLAQSFRNILCVLAAEAVRRRHRLDLAAHVMSGCTNECYRVLVGRWLERTERVGIRRDFP